MKENRGSNTKVEYVVASKRLDEHMGELCLAEAQRRATGWRSAALVLTVIVIGLFIRPDSDDSASTVSASAQVCPDNPPANFVSLERQTIVHEHSTKSTTTIIY